VTLVPTIDAASPSGADLRAVDTACRDHGFFLLANHGLDDVLRRTWRETERFFDAPRSVRTAIMRDRDNPLGYFDRELTKRKRDHKEVFDFVDPTFAPVDARNRWPHDLPGFRETMTELYDWLSALTDSHARHRSRGARTRERVARHRDLRSSGQFGASQPLSGR